MSALPQLSVIVPTRNRARSLAAMLATLSVALQHAGATVEVLIVDNGSSDDSANVIAAWCAEHASRRALSQPQPGKSRALNLACAAAAAPLLAFTDDDVEIPADWIEAIFGFFSKQPQYAAVTGRICLPPAIADVQLLDKVQLYRTLPLFDAGDSICETKHLYGCNMAVQRAALAALGGFDERLGPGASGLHEDGDLARRLRAAGQRIAYNPRMLMWHTADPSRLTPQFFTYMHQADARSRFVQRGRHGVAYALRHWLGAAAVWLWWRTARNPRRAMRARGRMISHREFMRLSWRESCGA